MYLMDFEDFFFLTEENPLQKSYARFIYFVVFTSRCT